MASEGNKLQYEGIEIELSLLLFVFSFFNLAFAFIIGIITCIFKSFYFSNNFLL